MAELDGRIGAIHILAEVVDRGGSLNDRLTAQRAAIKAAQRGLCAEFSYGVLRRLTPLQRVLGQLMDKPLRPRDRPIYFLLLTGLYQLRFMDTAAHRVVNDCVEATRTLDRRWAKGLVNAVLRRYQREADELWARACEDREGRYAYPSWLIEALAADWPEELDTLLAAGNQRAPMTLRVNLHQGTRAAYLTRLEQAGIAASALAQSDSAVQLAAPTDVERLPGFATGAVSVQDLSAQLAAQLLSPAPGSQVLDAAAAPGGKTLHLLEQAGGDLVLSAADIDAVRLTRVEETLARGGYEGVRLVCADAAQVAQWWTGPLFDAVLADVPCTGLGVIRRHPDIKWLRRATDVAPLVQRQAQILDALWSQVKPGGKLLYCTCSVLKAENMHQIQAFLQRHNDAQLQPLELPIGFDTGYGWQVLSGAPSDGFFFALLQRSEVN